MSRSIIRLNFLFLIKFIDLGFWCSKGASWLSRIDISVTKALHGCSVMIFVLQTHYMAVPLWYYGYKGATCLTSEATGWCSRHRYQWEYQPCANVIFDNNVTSNRQISVTVEKCTSLAEVTKNKIEHQYTVVTALL